MASLLQQTSEPEYIHLLANPCISGTSLQKRAETYEATHKQVTLEEPAGTMNRGALLRKGVERASVDLIAILDCGDLAVPTRFETQRAQMDSGNFDVVGGYIAEFDQRPGSPSAIRIVPTDSEAITSFAKYRSPMNHSTALFSRDAVLEIGNYKPLQRMEDYDLWMRLLANGKRLLNMPMVLTNVHAGSGLYTRRGGVRYSLDEMRVIHSFYAEYGMLSFPELIGCLAVRTPVRLLPNTLRKIIYRRGLRDELNPNVIPHLPELEHPMEGFTHDVPTTHSDATVLSD